MLSGLDLSILDGWTRADWLSLGQLVFTVLGFGAAIYQLSRTATATQQTAKSLADVKSRLVENDLLVLLPQLLELEDAIDEAVKKNDRNEIEKRLVAYARIASQVAAMIEVSQLSDEASLMGLLRQTASAATRAKADLAKGDSRDLLEVLRLVTGKMARVSTASSGLQARLQRKVPIP